MWNERYQTGDLPWDTGIPEPRLVEFIDSGVVKPGRTLEVGCGTGTNALFLASRGFDVTGVDLAQLAVEKARAKLGEVRNCRFDVCDFLSAPPSGGPFDFVFDRGCFHVFDEPAQRARFAENVAAVLAPGGAWLSIIGSTEGAPRDAGPPRRSARDVITAIEPHLELAELRSMVLRTDPETVMAWRCLSRKRLIPAQPSTRR